VAAVFRQTGRTVGIDTGCSWSSMGRRRLQSARRRRKAMGDNCCGGAVDVGALEARQRRVLNIVLAINVASFLMMVGASLYTQSSSLLSGTLDNMGDALTYALSLAVIGASAQAKARVALVKAALILAAAIAVAMQIGWRLANPAVPLFEGMGIAALLNLGANFVCLRLLTPYRHGDVNMASAWECSRNDMLEGAAVIAAALGVWAFDAGWPDLAVAAALLLLFVRSAWRVFRAAWRAHSLGRH
jgi:Co/Zn/Cd efflux system component